MNIGSRTAAGFLQACLLQMLCISSGTVIGKISVAYKTSARTTLALSGSMWEEQSSERSEIRNSHTFRTQNITGSSLAARNLLILKEAVIGIEPMNKGFAVFDRNCG
jgi:hypothetical protein